MSRSRISVPRTSFCADACPPEPTLLPCSLASRKLILAGAGGSAQEALKIMRLPRYQGFKEIEIRKLRFKDCLGTGEEQRKYSFSSESDVVPM